MVQYLSARDRIFLLLSLSSDFFPKYTDFSAVPVDLIYGTLAGKFISRASINQAIFRGLKEKLIEKVEKDGVTALKLTSTGKKQLFHDFPAIRFRGKPWDREWRFVTFDISEPDRVLRDKLRLRLKTLGLSMMQESLYLTPFDILEELHAYLDAEGLLKYVYIFEAEGVLGTDPKKIAAEVWKLEDLNRLYKKIIFMVHQAGGVEEMEKSELCNRYLDVLAVDPLLPIELLSLDWSAEKVRRMIKG
jgi:phenylacetic acid degradation operon negative regulatory protein